MRLKLKLKPGLSRSGKIEIRGTHRRDGQVLYEVHWDAVILDPACSAPYVYDTELLTPEAVERLTGWREEGRQ